MVNLRDLQKSLNTDGDLRDEFFNDPVKVLSKKGFVIPNENEAEVRDLTFQAKARISTAGSSITDAANPRVGPIVSD